MMVTQNKQPQTGVNPGNKGPVQPQDVKDPHPADEEGYGRERRPRSDKEDDKVVGGKRPSDTSRASRD
jgi:hypothetical protein